MQGNILTQTLQQFSLVNFCITGSLCFSTQSSNSSSVSTDVGAQIGSSSNGRCICTSPTRFSPILRAHCNNSICAFFSVKKYNKKFRKFSIYLTKKKIQFLSRDSTQFDSLQIKNQELQFQLNQRKEKECKYEQILPSITNLDS